MQGTTAAEIPPRAVRAPSWHRREIAEGSDGARRFASWQREPARLPASRGQAPSPWQPRQPRSSSAPALPGPATDRSTCRHRQDGVVSNWGACIPRDSPDLSGCPGLLPGWASVHARIVRAARRDATSRGGDSQTPASAMLLAHALLLANARARAASSRGGARDQPPLRASSFSTSALQNLLDSRGLSLMWGQAAVIGLA